LITLSFSSWVRTGSTGTSRLLPFAVVASASALFVKFIVFGFATYDEVATFATLTKLPRLSVLSM
jgi:hypothetical protein